MSSRCPRCKARCTEDELVSAIYDAPAKPVIAIKVDEDTTVYLATDAADRLGLSGTETWQRREVTRSGATRMTVVDTENGPAFMEASVAKTLGYSGRQYWKHESDKVCGACVEELRRGKRAHRSWSSAKRKWRSA